MGALRAAKLSPFGMVGVGRIFEAYRSGVLEPYGDVLFEDDDEVAVIHGPPEMGYVALSEALVNIRATLAKGRRWRDRRGHARSVCASRQGNVLSGTQLGIAARARSRSRRVAAGDRGSRAWLPQGRVDLKRRDALEMLAAMRTFLDTSQAPKQVTYDFAHTTLWDNAVAASESEDKGTVLCRKRGMGRTSRRSRTGWRGPAARWLMAHAGLVGMRLAPGIEVSTRERRQGGWPSFVANGGSPPPSSSNAGSSAIIWTATVPTALWTMRPASTSSRRHWGRPRHLLGSTMHALLAAMRI